VRTPAQVPLAAEDASAWSLVFVGFDPAKEGIREALCTLGNGYFATRAAAVWVEADASITLGPISLVATTACKPILPAARLRTRTSSTSPTGLRCGFGSLKRTGSIWVALQFCHTGRNLIFSAACC